MKVFIIALLIASLAIGCLAFSQKPPGGPVEFETVMTGQHSLIDTASVILVDNAELWSKIWNLAQGKIEPMPATPDIDFAEYSIIAVFMGQKNNSGYSVKVSELIQDGNNLTVRVINHISVGGMMLPVVTNPCHMVKLPAGEYELQVEYTEQKE